MIELIKGLPDNVVRVKVSGTVSSEDYEKVLIPEVKKKLEKYDKISVLYQVDSDFDKYEFSALLDDSKLGLGNFFSWDRIAVVTDKRWIGDGAKVFGFMMPAKVNVFSTNELNAAKDWISEKREGMEISTYADTNIVMLEPHDPMTKSDFERAEKMIDLYIQSHGELHGLIIHTKVFPGWDSAGSFMAHMNFIKKHHKYIRGLAFATDSKLIDITESIGSYIVDMEVKSFGYDEVGAAKAWIQSL